MRDKDSKLLWEAYTPTRNVDVHRLLDTNNVEDFRHVYTQLLRDYIALQRPNDTPDEAHALLAQFLAKYDEAVQKWLDKLPEWKEWWQSLPLGAQHYGKYLSTLGYRENGPRQHFAKILLNHPKTQEYRDWPDDSQYTA